MRFAALAAAGVVALAAGVASARGVSTAPVLGASRTLSPRVPRASSPSAPLAALLRTPLPRQGIALVLVLPWLLWPPPGFQSLPYRVSLALLVMAVMEVPVAVREGRLFRPLLLVGFGFLAATVIRNIPLITPAALAILGPAWTTAVRELGERRSGLLARRVCAAVAVLVVMGTLWLRLGDRLGTDVRAPSRTGWGVDDERFPVGAVDALARAAPTGALLNNFDSGGYLLYRLHPGRRVFIAGNTSMYPPTFLEYYRANVTGADVRLDEVHRDHAVVAAIVDLPSATTRLVMALATDPAWRLAFFDRGGALFVRDGGAATDHPARAPLDVPTRVRELVATDDAAPGLPTWLGGKRLAFPSFNLGLFLEAIGRPDLAVNEALRIWPLAPDENVAVFGGRAAQACGRLVDFLTPLEEGSTRFPQNDAIRRLLFLALAFRSDRSLNGGALAEAAADLERMATLEPASCGPPYALAKIAVVQRDAARAERWLAAGRALDGDGTCGRGAAADPVLQPFMAKRP